MGTPWGAIHQQRRANEAEEKADETMRAARQASRLMHDELLALARRWEQQAGHSDPAVAPDVAGRLTQCAGQLRDLIAMHGVHPGLDQR